MIESFHVKFFDGTYKSKHNEGPQITNPRVFKSSIESREVRELEYEKITVRTLMLTVLRVNLRL